MKRAALYIRVSTDEQALHGDSVETQKKELKSYALKSNYQIIDFYVDDGYTATNLNRPDLKRLLYDVEKNKIDIILFTKIDRWSRGVRNYYKIQDVLDKYKTDWKTIFEDYDTTTASGRLHINIMLSVAENESAQTSERIRAVFKTKLAKGEVVSGKIPRGYKIEDKKLVIDDEVAPIIKDIYDYYEKTNSLNRTMTYVKNNYFSIHQVTLKRLLSNPLYKGAHRCASAETENYCEAIIEERQWDNVQRLLNINQKKYFTPTRGDIIYIFSGLLKCKECGRSLTGNGRIKYNKTRGEYQYKVYRCQGNFKEHRCSNNYNIPETNILEKYLVDNLQSELQRYILDSKARLTNKPTINTSNLKTTLKQKLERLKDLYVDGLIDKELYRKDFTNLNAQLSALEEETPAIKKDISNFEHFLDLDIKSYYYELDEMSRRRFWLSIIDYVVIGNDRNDITIKFL